MHEFSLMQGVMDAVDASARAAGASRVLEVRLRIGELAEVVDDAMQFAFEALSPETLADGGQLIIEHIEAKSRCAACNSEFKHDRLHWSCPNCDSLATELISGKELYIDSIEIETD
jgi:hydrogenase nickel incorporation protein HypA/HybF